MTCILGTVMGAKASSEGGIRGEIASILQNGVYTAQKTSCRQNQSTAVFCMEKSSQNSQNKFDVYSKYLAKRAVGSGMI